MQSEAEPAQPTSETIAQLIARDPVKPDVKAELAPAPAPEMCDGTDRCVAQPAPAPMPSPEPVVQKATDMASIDARRNSDGFKLNFTFATPTPACLVPRGGCDVADIGY